MCWDEDELGWISWVNDNGIFRLVVRHYVGVIVTFAHPCTYVSLGGERGDGCQRCARVLHMGMDWICMALAWYWYIDRGRSALESSGRRSLDGIMKVGKPQNTSVARGLMFPRSVQNILMSATTSSCGCWRRRARLRFRRGEEPEELKRTILLLFQTTLYCPCYDQTLFDIVKE